MRFWRVVLTGLVLFFVLTEGRTQAKPVLLDSSAHGREKIYLHTDKGLYLGGETIWFKAYVMSEGLPALTATNLYISLLDNTGKVLQRKLFPLSGGAGDGSFTLADSLFAGNLWLAAHTVHSSDSSLVYYKAIPIVSRKTSTATPPTASTLQLLPEGGTFTAGVANHVAFKATLGNGFPLEIKGWLKNGSGVLLDSIAAMHNGMGEFVCTPVMGEKYHIEWRDETGQVRQTDLPPASTTLSLHTEQVNGYLYYVVQNPSPEKNLEEIHISIAQDDEDVYQARLDMSTQPVFSGKLSLNKLHTGIVRITASGKDGEPVAERISFVGTDYRFDATVTMTETGMGKRGKNTLEIEIPDTVAANLSLSVHDAQFAGTEGANIYTDLLLTDEIRGYVHEPGWYFAGPGRAKALDLVMLTHGWRRYRKQETGQPDNYITVSGVVTDHKKRLRSNQSVTLMIAGKDSSRQFFNVTTDPLGRFTKSGLFFYDTSTLFIQFNRQSGDPDMQVAVDKTGPAAYSSPGRPIAMVPYPVAQASTILSGNTQLFVPQKISDGFTEKGYRLNDVTVKSRRDWRKDPMLLMDEKYTTGIFRANATAFSFDVLNDPMKNTRGDIMNYLFGKVPGLAIQYAPTGGGQKTLVYGVGSNKQIVEHIFIDEHVYYVDTQDPLAAHSELQSLNLEDIAYIKFFPRHPLQPDKPALAIYLKKGDEPDPNGVSVLPKVKIAGYNTVKEFYSPDYSLAEHQKAVLDKRTTLYWLPYIFTDKNNRKQVVHFYNNDNTTEFRIVLEGMNEAGKLVHIEKNVK